MMVNQIAVFLENRKGRLYDFAQVLSDNKIDLITMSIADTKEFGILRAVTSDNKRAVQVLKSAGFIVQGTDLIGLEVEDKPGGLARVLKLFDASGVEIEYLYSFARKEADKAIILIKVNDLVLAKKVIIDNDIKVLDETLN